MASKINTDNPKHHKYVDVNKYERKKIIKKKYNIIYNFINNVYNYITSVHNLGYYLSYVTYSLKYASNHFNYKYVDDYENPYFNKKKCIVVYDDCNHKTYRVIKNGKFVKKFYSISHFKRT